MIFVRTVNKPVCFFPPSSVFLIPIGMRIRRVIFFLLGKIPFPNFLNIAWYLRQYDSYWV